MMFIIHVCSEIVIDYKKVRFGEEATTCFRVRVHLSLNSSLRDQV